MTLATAPCFSYRIASYFTLTSAFTTAAQTKSGPDIATQWATLPTLTPAWNGSSVPISDYVPASETKNLRPLTT